jgi:hypothetical protein
VSQEDRRRRADAQQGGIVTSLGNSIIGQICILWESIDMTDRREFPSLRSEMYGQHYTSCADDNNDDNDNDTERQQRRHRLTDLAICC